MPRSYQRWALDFEVEGWEHFVLGAAVSEEGERRVFRTTGEVARWYCHQVDPRDEIWTFNGGRFDAKLLCDCLVGHRIRGNCAGSDLVSVRARGRARVLDLARLAPFMSLRECSLGFGGGTLKGDLELPCECGECDDDEVHYCAVRRDMPATRRKLVADYCIRDCEATLAAHAGLVTFLEKMELQTRGRAGSRATLGSIAWATAKALAGDEAPEPLAPDDFERYDLHRRSYYGGNCQVIRWRSERGRLWDLRRAYLSAMHRPLPRRVLKRVAPADGPLSRDRPGAYRIEADCPGTVPLLPMRGDSRLVWATGRIVGWYHLAEIRAAERHGLRVRRVREAILYDERPWLRPYVERVWRQAAIELGKSRAKRDAHAIRAVQCKSAGNVLSGKTAQDKQAGTLVLGTDDVPDGSHRLGDGAWIVMHSRVPDCAHLLSAGAITMVPRIALMDRQADPRAGSVYGDTDSGHGEGAPPDDVGDEHGQWHDDGPYRDFEALAPKVYRYRDARGKWVVRAKGFPDFDARAFAHLKQGHVIRRRKGTAGVRSALRASDGARCFAPRDVARRIDPRSPVAGTRLKLPDGGTVALRRGEDGSYRWPGSRLRPERILDL